MLGTPRLLLAAPSKPPSNVAVIVTSSTSADVSWQLPPEEERNGVITGFKLKHLKKDGTSWTTKDITDRAKRSSALTGLSKFTYYDYQVLAYTSKGDGPTSSVQSFQTLQDGEYDAVVFELGYPVITSLPGPQETLIREVRATDRRACGKPSGQSLHGDDVLDL